MDTPYIDPTADGAARLMDGAAQNEGRIEVNYKGAFGSVCGDSFGTSEAATLCHQLGFAGVSRVAPCCQFGQTSGEIWLDNVDCGTGEVWLANCTHRGWGVEDCHHGQDVGVVCNGMYICWTVWAAKHIYSMYISKVMYYDCQYCSLGLYVCINLSPIPCLQGL